MSIAADVRITHSRQRIQVRGIVQGVGFRPFVYGLAVELGLAGFVCNDGAGVTIEVEGEAAGLEQFLSALRTQAPPLASIDSLTATQISAGGEQSFAIIPSQPGTSRETLISPDVATCAECLQELQDPADRRFHYPFINCTNCGPRFTIVKDVPYDRDKTTVGPFALCPACRAEYENPLERRFHAQPNACPRCGPTLELRFAAGDRQLAGDAALGEAARRLARGQIVAVKGLGGYHLACDALNETAVATLRRRKRREAKPFALLVPDLETARQLCFVNRPEAELLESRRRPIVLLRQRPECLIAPAVAPGYSTLGLMLPYTPLHTLLLEAFGRETAGAPLTVLVLTSGNVSDEPIAYGDEEARERLGAIADAFLGHDREIYTRCDDSVTAILEVEAPGSSNGRATHLPLILRRSRGYVPEPIRLQRPFPLPLLAVGGHLKNTFCLGRGRQAFLSQHIGDLENLETLQSFAEGVTHFMRLFDVRPECIAHDLHPGYLSTQWAQNAQSVGAVQRPAVAVQHHHAHIASVLAEHGLNGPVIGIAADGTGYGTDGAVWGGEVMVADLARFERVAHLAYVPLPGGEQAIRQPWRMAAVYLQQAAGDEFLKLDIPFVWQLEERRWRPLAQMMERELNCPPTSSLGRLFDAVAALLTGRNEVVYEGQAAIELEMVAVPAGEAYPFKVAAGWPLQLDVRPLMRAIVREIERGTAAPLIAGRFHRTVAEMLLAVCGRVREETGLQQVALSGGVFQNRLLLGQLLPLLEAAGFQSYINQQVPANDGGLSLGQAAVAAARLMK